MNVLIVDDNSIARATIKQLSSQIKDIVVVGECATAIEAYNVLQEEVVDLIFLDIEMPEMTGLELTKNLGKSDAIIVFTTSKTEYAAEAFELNVVDYIVKPVTVTRFLHAIEKVREILDSKQGEVKLEDEAFIFVRDSNIIRRLAVDDILYIEAMGDYAKIHTAQKFYAIHTTIKAVEEKLNAKIFMRVHRSYIVAITKIDSIQNSVLSINGKPIPVADAYRAALNRRLDVL